MTSGGPRARSGPAPDPKSYRSLDRDWVELPIDGYDGGAPDFPLPLAVVMTTTYDDEGNKTRGPDHEASRELRKIEADLWEKLWEKPQAAAWVQLGLEFQVAAYVRAFVESTSAEAPASLKTAVLRMESELGISVAGMRANLWKIADPAIEDEVERTGKKPAGKGTSRRKTGGSTWLEGVTVAS